MDKSLDKEVFKNETSPKDLERDMSSNEAGVDIEAEKEIIHRVDWRLLPILGAIYSAALIDRGNMAIAAVSGMTKDLRLDIDNRYSVCLLMFFIPYALFEMPSNVVLRKVGAAVWLSTIGLLWGAVMIGIGFVHDFASMTVLRTILGFFEAGFFPGCVYLISCWYVRYETQRRLAGFYMTSVLISGFAAILGYGLSHLDGRAGLAGWRWIFIVEGLITCVFSLAAYFIIIDFPEAVSKMNRPFLTEKEVQIVKARIDRDRDDSVTDPLTWSKAITYLGDWKLWCYALMFMSTTTCTYALTYFLPQILLGLGFDTGKSQLLTAPPYVFTFFFGLVLAAVADRTRMRAPIIAAQAIMCMVGLLLTAYGPNHAVKYFGTFLGLAGAQSNVPAMLSYQANNIRMNSKRSFGSALQVGFGAIGGIMASTIYREQDAPGYINGLWATVGCQLLILVLLSITTVFFWKKNREQRDGTLREPIEGHPDFTYTY